MIPGLRGDQRATPSGHRWVCSAWKLCQVAQQGERWTRSGFETRNSHFLGDSWGPGLTRASGLQALFKIFNHHLRQILPLLLFMNRLRLREVRCLLRSCSWGLLEERAGGAGPKSPPPQSAQHRGDRPHRERVPSARPRHTAALCVCVCELLVLSLIHI